MGVQVTHKEIVEPPIEAVRLYGLHNSREIIVRPTVTSPDPSLRTVECTHYGAQGFARESFKWAATLDTLQEFGEALVQLAKEGKAAL